jgi:hypothetical protein
MLPNAMELTGQPGVRWKLTMIISALKVRMKYLKTAWLLLFLGFPVILVAEPALWKVQSGTATVYLFGSIHVADKSVYPLNEQIENAFQRSDVLVVEVDETQADPVELNNLMLSKGLYPVPETVAQHIDKSTYQQLQGFLKKTGIPYATIARMRPGVIAITLTVARLQQLGYSPELGIDRYFMQKARAAEKEIAQLETAIDQLNLLLGFSNEDLLLKHTIISLDQADTLFKEILQAWKAGDVNKIEQIMLEDPVSDYPEFESLMERMFVKRNINMTQSISELLQTKQTYFVVVGAGHMVGDQGIVALMKDHGFTVNRLSINP